MSDWQPIDTAPKDGTRVLVTYPDGQHLDVAYWHVDHLCGENDGWAPFSHWMPIPSLPNVKPDKPQCEIMHPDEDGWSDWIHPLPGYLLQCCDCGLVHEMQFEIAEPHQGMGDGDRNPGESDSGVVIFRARRFEEENHRD